MRSELDLDGGPGELAKTILEIAEDPRADLTVIGLRQAAGPTSHVQANVAYRVVVVAGAECPVLTVPAISDSKD